MDSAFYTQKKFCKEKITPLGYKQSEISERENFTFTKSRFFSQFFRKFHFLNSIVQFRHNLARTYFYHVSRLQVKRLERRDHPKR